VVAQYLPLIPPRAGLSRSSHGALGSWAARCRLVGSNAGKAQWTVGRRTFGMPNRLTSMPENTRALEGLN
jgi:hypothetical protein